MKFHELRGFAQWFTWSHVEPGLSEYAFEAYERMTDGGVQVVEPMRCDRVVEPSVELNGIELKAAFRACGYSAREWRRFWLLLKHCPSYTVRHHGVTVIDRGRVL